MDHVDCRLTVFTDGSAIPGTFSPSASDAELASAVEDRLSDDRFVLAELGRLNLTEPVVAGTLDLSRLGALGWSLGCSDLVELAQADPRFKGVVMLEGYLQGANSVVQSGLNGPLLAIYREDSVERSLFAKASSDAYLCQAHLPSHFEFKDLTELPFSPEAARRGTAAIRACMLSFFKKYLRGQDDHLLDNPIISYPALFNFQKR